MISPKASIIVPVYRVEKYLPSFLEALLEQGGGIPYEAIFVDDGSDDECGAILEEYKKKHPDRMVVLHTDNRGAGEARNVGLSRAKGEFVLFCDPDDVPERDYLLALVETFQRVPEADCASARYKTLDEKEKVATPLFQPQGVYEGKVAAEKLLADVFLSAFLWNKAFRRSLLEERAIRFYPFRSAYEDLPFCFASFLMSRRVAFSKKVVYAYRTKREGSAMNGAAGKGRLTDHVSALYACRAFADRVLPREEALRMFRFKRFRFYLSLLADLEAYKGERGRAFFDGVRLLHRLADPVLPVRGTVAEKSVLAYGKEGVLLKDGSRYDRFTDPDIGRR